MKIVPRSAIVLLLLFAHCGLPSYPPGLGIAVVGKYQWRRVSSTDPSGGNTDYRLLQPGQPLELASIDGPGVITHLWFTILDKDQRQHMILRAYWDNERRPSIEAPLGLFFGVGHDDDRIPHYTNAFFDVSPEIGLNSHLPMPFRRHARLTLTYEGGGGPKLVYYYVDYTTVSSLPSDTGYLHAMFHEETPCAPGQDYVFATATGRGHILGVNLAVEARQDAWWGEGDDKITIDGTPIMQGTGTEDYFGGSWNFKSEHAGLYEGSPRLEGEHSGGRHIVYRFHGPDPIPFQKSFRYASEHGHDNTRADNWASVAYWYQVKESLLARWAAVIFRLTPE